MILSVIYRKSRKAKGQRSSRSCPDGRPFDFAQGMTDGKLISLGILSSH